MARRANRFIGLVLTAVLAFVGVSALNTINAPAASAADASRFDPGLIISDSVFFDFGTMTVAEIQRFLESKVPVCADDDGGPKCLRNYLSDTVDKAGEDGRCQPVTGKTSQTAAQIIYEVAHACGINPRVLLVKLQKEQGLIQAKNPTTYMYKAAMGYGCPDSDPGICGKVYVGLFNQLYHAAGQLNWYDDPRSSFVLNKKLPLGKVSKVLLNPSSSCGTKEVLIKSNATRALYFYTPYTPNAAALKNLYSSGDSCSAYGNRNFWRFFTDWFGDPVAGGFLLKSASSGTYLIVDNNKYLVSDADTIKAYAPLGPVGTISKEYLATFTDGGAIGRVFKSTTGQLYYADSGKKFTFSSCDQVTQFGLDCTTAVTLSASQISAMAVGGPMTQYVGGDGSDTYFIQGGQKRQILDRESVAAAGITLPALSNLKVSALKNLPWGKPLIRNGAIFTNSTTGNRAVYLNDNYAEIAPATASEIDFGKWFSPSTGTVTTDGVSTVASISFIKTIVSDANGTHYLLTTDGRRLIENGTDLVKDAPIVPEPLLLTIAASTATPIATPFFAKSTVAAPVYLVRKAQKRLVITTADRAKFAPAMNDATVQALTPSAMAQIEAGQPAFAPGTYLKSSDSNTAYLIDGYDRALVIPSVEKAAQLGLTAKIRTVKASDFKGYNKKAKFESLKVACQDLLFLTLGSKLINISAEDAVHYPGAIISLDALTCATLKKSQAADDRLNQIGRFIRTPDKAIWLLQKGKKLSIASAAAYATLRGERLPLVLVDAYFASLIPTGGKAPATLPAVVNPTPSASPSPAASPSPSASPKVSASPRPSTSASPSPSASPKVSATPKPSISPSPSTSVKPKTYTVVSGDTLTKIANRFGVTTTALMTANKITNANNIRLGQVLVIP